MEEFLVVNDLDCYPLLRCAAALGWSGMTPVEVLCDLRQSRIVIQRSGQPVEKLKQPGR